MATTRTTTRRHGRLVVAEAERPDSPTEFFEDFLEDEYDEFQITAITPVCNNLSSNNNNNDRKNQPAAAAAAMPSHAASTVVDVDVNDPIPDEYHQNDEGGATVQHGKNRPPQHISLQQQQQEPSSMPVWLWWWLQGWLFGHSLSYQHRQWRRTAVTVLRELLAECLGSFLLVFFATGASMAAVTSDALVDLFQLSSLSIMGWTLAISTTASISGAHLNPAISVAFCLFRPGPTFGWRKCAAYVVAQTVGAMVAVWCNLAMYASTLSAFEAAQGLERRTARASAASVALYYEAPVTAAQAFFAEVVRTAILVGVVFSLTRHNRQRDEAVYTPPFIGITAGGLMGLIAPFIPAGFNPARDVASRLVAYAAGWTAVAFDQAWVYTLAPLVGAPLGAVLVDKIIYVDPPPPTVTTATKVAPPISYA